MCRVAIESMTLRECTTLRALVIRPLGGPGVCAKTAGEGRVRI